MVSPPTNVNVGRSHINFQDLGAQEIKKEAVEHLALICKEVREKGCSADVPDHAQGFEAIRGGHSDDLCLVAIFRQ